MSSTLPLAALIASMDRESLSDLVASRRVVSPASVLEPLGLAIELLRADSISRALQSAHRDSLAALLAISEGNDADPAILDHLAKRGLVGLRSDENAPAHDTKFVPLPEVSDALPSAFLAEHAEPIQLPEKPDDLTGWFAAGLTSVRRVAKMLHTIASQPIRLGRKGRPAVVAVRDLAEAAHCTPEQSAHLVDVMQTAGLLSVHRDRTGPEYLRVTDVAAQRWLMQLDYPERWIELARAAVTWFDSRLLRGIEQSHGNLQVCAAQLPNDYPLLPEAELEPLLSAIQTADELGLTVQGWLTKAGEALLRGDEPAALDLAVRDMPALAAGIYLQPDLSIIVPGPLPPHDEAILNSITETEQLGPAASLRVSPERLSRAVLRAGSSTDDIREALTRLSLTGIPQPLDYLLRDLDRRSSEHTLGQEHLPQSLYLAAQEPSTGTPPALPGAANVAAPDAETSATSPVSAHDTELQHMVERVFTAASDAGSEGDLTRRLELAIRDRTLVRVTAIAGKDEREFTLLPVSLKAGRLRASDQLAGVERTLPVSAISAVELVQP